MKNKKNFTETIKYLEALVAENHTIRLRKIKKGSTIVYILFVNEISDRSSISDNIILPITEFENVNISIDEIFSGVIYVDDIKLDND